ncbi:MAG: penicillin acylase family protein [Gemmatimonadota bacterium]|nr:penicillin acylase family protein [Gemmatimonadota bacterium]
MTCVSRRWHARLTTIMSVAALGCAAAVGGPEYVSEGAAPGEPRLVSQVEIARTAFGVPHITAHNVAALGFGLAYCQLEDHGDRVVLGLVRARGELALHFGPDSLDSDFFFRRRRARALETYHLLSRDARDLYEGFAQGINWYIALHPDEFAEWVAPSFTGHDVHGRFILMSDQGDVADFVTRLAGSATPDALNDDGSNAWAFAPSRTVSGHPILLRNPHLSWNAGYYEVHLRIPGRLDFYGDVRVGYPLFYIGGFNRHLGWATTNNGPDLDDIYALDVDPIRTDHYMFNGKAVPLLRETVTAEFKNGAGRSSETREFWRTPLGPVVHRGAGKIYVLRSAAEGEYRMVDQYLRMMQATNLAEWKSAMRMRSHPSSNFTYADADGNIFYVWNARLPARPHPPDGDTVAVAAAGSADVWTTLVPFDSLPQLLNPTGGYLHNENDPFHFTNLYEPFDPLRFGSNYPAPELGLRSQLALSLIHDSTTKLTLEDVIALKHTTRMLLADRVKDDLIRAIRAHAPEESEVAQAATLLEQWDNTVDPESRGGVLFEAWFAEYLALLPDVESRADRLRAAFATPWTIAAPVITPRGLADLDRAVAAFKQALSVVRERFGSWEVAWGDVHRVRRGDVDVPVGGCPGWLGCFRTLSFTPDADGALVASRGDAWVLAVEFADPPRARSVLAYGQSGREDSPHFSDQAAVFAQGRLKPVAFTDADIEAQLTRRYRPGREKDMTH